MHIKTMRDHLTPVKMAIIKKLTVLVRIWRKWNPHVLLVGMYISIAKMENSMEVSQRIKNVTTIQSSNSTFGYFLEKKKKTLINV